MSLLGKPTYQDILACLGSLVLTKYRIQHAFCLNPYPSVKYILSHSSYTTCMSSTPQTHEPSFPPLQVSYSLFVQSRSILDVEIALFLSFLIVFLFFQIHLSKVNSLHVHSFTKVVFYILIYTYYKKPFLPSGTVSTAPNHPPNIGSYLSNLQRGRLTSPPKSTAPDELLKSGCGKNP